MYAAHVESLRRHLDKEILELHDRHSLHDSHLRQLVMSGTPSTVEMWLDGRDLDGNSRPYHLTYAGVLALRSQADPEQGLVGPSIPGDQVVPVWTPKPYFKRASLTLRT